MVSQTLLVGETSLQCCAELMVDFWLPWAVRNFDEVVAVELRLSEDDFDKCAEMLLKLIPWA